MNIIFKKIYLLVGVIMAANMFIVNDVKATDTNSNFEANELINPGKKMKVKKPSLENVLYYIEWFSCHVLSYENTINLIGGAVFSCANNYLKLWDYNPERYFKLGCFGWRTKKLFGMLQLEGNLNIGRGISWLIPGAYNVIKFFIKNKENDNYVECLHVSYLVTNFISNKGIITIIGFFLLQGFVSIPLTFHLSKFNFSISISLDSIIWMGIGYILELKVKKEIEKKRIEEKIGISGGDYNERIYDDDEN